MNGALVDGDQDDRFATGAERQVVDFVAVRICEAEGVLAAGMEIGATVKTAAADLATPK